MDFKASLLWSVVLIVVFIIALKPVAASAAGTPSLVNVAMDAATSSKLIPNCEAVATTLPITGAISSASTLPARTKPVNISVALPALITSDP